MKKILVFVLIFGLIGAFIIPLFFSDDTTDETKFQFQFNENLLVKSGQVVTISFEIIDKLFSIDLLVNGERLKTWKNPNVSINFKFDTKKQ